MSYIPVYILYIASNGTAVSAFDRMWMEAVVAYHSHCLDDASQDTRQRFELGSFRADDRCVTASVSLLYVEC